MRERELYLPTVKRAAAAAAAPAASAAAALTTITNIPSATSLSGIYPLITSTPCPRRPAIFL